MGSIICSETDEKLLEKIYNSTNVRVQPRKGIITPVCEYCRNRIDEYDENFKPYEKEYFLELMDGDKIGTALHDVIDPLAEPPLKGDSHTRLEEDENASDGIHAISDENDAIRQESSQGEENAISRSKRVIVRHPTQCTVCGKVVKSMSDHMKVHSIDKKYKCTFCDRSFAQSNNLTYHLRQHTGEKPYQCDLCDKQFINKLHLTSHQKCHTNDKEFQCEYCCKRFNHLGNLNKHQRVHSGERPYPCKFCARTFSNISNKKSHEKRHRGERNFACAVCSKSFHDAHHLERHSTVHQKNRKRGKEEADSPS
uniref:C2H2-type domain-containing protein n=1 Tax=Anopheles dirus TaxID=7168 RepID=A0A182NTD9_9DIPT